MDWRGCCGEIPTDAERVLWQRLTTDRRFAGTFKRQTPVGRHIPDFVSFVRRLAIELVNPDETEVIAKDRADRQIWLEARGYRVVAVSAEEITSDLASVLGRFGNRARDVGAHLARLRSEVTRSPLQTLTASSGHLRVLNAERFDW